MAAQFSFLENAFEGFRYQPAFIEPSDEDALVTRVREAFIVPTDENDLLNRLHKAYDVANAVDWRLHDVNIVPVRSLE